MSQRTGTKILTLEEQLTVKGLLELPNHPSEPPRILSEQIPENPQARRSWTGQNNPQAREKLRADLTNALEAALAEVTVDVRRKATARRLPMERFHGVANAAKLVVNTAFRDWLTNAAVPPATAATRVSFSFTSLGDHPTLLDCTSVEVRKTTPQPVTDDGAARYLAGTDPACRKLVREASLDHAHGTPEERNFFNQDVIAPFVQKHSAALMEYDRFGFLITDPNFGRVFLQPNVVGWQDGEDETADVVAQKKWKDFKLIVHEYIHVLEHPAIPVTTSRSDCVREGFCEYLTREVMHGLGFASRDLLERIGRLVTGDEFFPSVKYFTDYTVAEKYQAYVAEVDEAVKIIGSNGLKAAYFQGHTEFLGLDPRGWITPVRDGPHGRTMALPHSCAGTWSADALARLTGKSVVDLATWSPDIGDRPRQWKDGLELQIVVPGFHGHRVFAWGQKDTADRVVETWEQIAAQNGISLASLVALNPEKPGEPGHAPIEALAGDWLLIRNE